MCNNVVAGSHLALYWMCAQFSQPWSYGWECRGALGFNGLPRLGTPSTDRGSQLWNHIKVSPWAPRTGIPNQLTMFPATGAHGSQACYLLVCGGGGGGVPGLAPNQRYDIIWSWSPITQLDLLPHTCVMAVGVIVRIMHQIPSYL